MPIIRKIQASVPDCTYHVNFGLGAVTNFIDQYDVDLNPVYQRDYVWSEEQKILFVGAAIENPNAVPAFWLNWVSKDFRRSHSEIVDGKQRLSAIISWMGGKIPAVCPCGETVWYKDLDEVDLRNIDSGTSLDFNFVELNPKEVMKFYIRLNSGGTVHSKDDIEKVRKMIDEMP